MNFDQLGLSQNILSAITDKGYTVATDIQLQAIPQVLKGKDLMATAQTGTGKTASFTLPILEILASGTPARANQVRCLIVAPTRELAAQVADNIAIYGKNLSLRTNAIFGGVRINPQIAKVRRGTDILISTPGRLLDLHNQRALKLNELEIVVLDEADRMLDMGFMPDIKRIFKLLPKQRQTLMFSATFSAEMKKMAQSMLHNPVEIAIAADNSTVDTIKHWLHPVDKNKKNSLLTHLIKENGWFQVLVFSRTKHGADRIAKQLTKEGIKSIAIHGNKSQAARIKALADFKKAKYTVLVATDIASRGLDIRGLPHVVNFDLPEVAADYVHRIGRTGRAKKKGEAISLVTAAEAKLLNAIEKLIKSKIERVEVEGFEPKEKIPEVLNNKQKGGKSRTSRTRRSSSRSGGGNSSSSNKPHRSSRRKSADGRGYGKPSKFANKGHRDHTEK